MKTGGYSTKMGGTRGTGRRETWEAIGNTCGAGFKGFRSVQGRPEVGDWRIRRDLLQMQLNTL